MKPDDQQRVVLQRYTDLQPARKRHHRNRIFFYLKPHDEKEGAICRCNTGSLLHSSTTSFLFVISKVTDQSEELDACFVFRNVRYLSVWFACMFYDYTPLLARNNIWKFKKKKVIISNFLLSVTATEFACHWEFSLFNLFML